MVKQSKVNRSINIDFIKRIVFYPVLFAINPILLMYAVNMSDLPPSVLFPIILIIPILTIGLMWLLYKLGKDFHRAGFVIFMLIMWFFYYIPFRIWIINHLRFGSNTIESPWFTFTLWSVLVLFLSSSWLWRQVKSPQTITSYLNLVCIILIGISMYRISKDLIPFYTYRPDIRDIDLSLSATPPNANLPDIYYIILDGYARQDVLQELYDYDNSAFIRSLEDRGFNISENSQSNYIQTILSLASSLNMEYLSGESGKPPNHGLLAGMIGHNRSRILLEHLGYKYVAFSTGFLPTSLANADYYYSFSNFGKSHDLEALLLMNSVLSPLMENGWIKSPMTRYSKAQARVNSIFELLGNDVAALDGPNFVFAHIVAPHPPFIFDQNGPVTPDEPFIFMGINTVFVDKNGYKEAYVSDLKYVNQRVMQTVDEILTNSKLPPIIIIQADHGPDAYMNWGTGENVCYKERFSILYAYYLPDQKSTQLYADITPINTFPILFNTYLGTHIDLLPNRQYFATWKNPFPFDDVTEISQTCEIK